MRQTEGRFGIRYYFLILLAFASAFLSAQTDDFIDSYVTSYPQTAMTAVQKPLTWNSTDWQIAGLLICTGTGLYLIDESITDFVRGNKNDFTEALAYIGNQCGDGKYVVPAIGATLLTGYLLDSPKTQDTALLSLKSFMLANGATASLKILTQRHRPFQQKGKKFWSGSGFSHTRDSFPSGHATVAWSVAPILAEQYKDVKWVPPTVYSLAGLTIFARVHDEKHWASDVFTGALIGFFTSQLVLKTTPRLQVAPTFEPQGITLYYNF